MRERPLVIVFAGGGYRVRRIPQDGEGNEEEYLVEHTPAPGCAHGGAHGTLWPTRRAAMEAVLRDLHARWGASLDAGDLHAVQDMATTTSKIVSFFLRGFV